MARFGQLVLQLRVGDAEALLDQTAILIGMLLDERDLVFCGGNLTVESFDLSLDARLLRIEQIDLIPQDGSLRIEGVLLVRDQACNVGSFDGG